MDYPQDCWGDNFKLNTNIDMSRGCNGFPWLYNLIIVYLVVVGLVTVWFLLRAGAATITGDWSRAWENLRIAWYVLLIGYMGPAAIIILMAWFAGSKGKSND